MTTLEGIVLRERTIGEQDKFIDVLTKDKGLIELSARGARKISGSSNSATQLFAYSKFCIEERNDRFRLNSSEPIHIFYDLRFSVTGLSLASYFADVLRFTTAKYVDSGRVLRLTLNTLHFLEKRLRSEAMLKAIFEMRLMSDIGFMPDVICCHKCGKFEPELLNFSVYSGVFYCRECVPENDVETIEMKLPELSALRHIVLADFNRLYNFRIPDDSMKRLGNFTEAYLKTHLERNFSTLDFYKSLL